MAFILLHYLISRYAVGNWLGEGDSFTVVDTPGFGDSDNDDNLLIDEVIEMNIFILTLFNKSQ